MSTRRHIRRAAGPRRAAPLPVRCENGVRYTVPTTIRPDCAGDTVTLRFRVDGGILMGLGYALAPGVMGVPGAATSGAAYTVGFLLVKAGGALIDNMAWLFAIGAAVGLADNDGTAGLAGLVSYLMMQQLLSPGVVGMVRTLEEGTATYIAFQKVAGNSFIGILAAVVGATCYNKFKEHPDA